MVSGRTVLRGCDLLGVWNCRIYEILRFRVSVSDEGWKRLLEIVMFFIRYKEFILMVWYPISTILTLGRLVTEKESRLAILVDFLKLILIDLNE